MEKAHHVYRHFREGGNPGPPLIVARYQTPDWIPAFAVMMAFL